MTITGRRVMLGALVLGACAPNLSRHDVRNPATTEYQVRVEETDFEMPSGMKALLLRDPTVDVVEVAVRYQVGSRDDPPGKAGLAHLVEHLMFSQRVGGADRASIGARLREHALAANAHTSHDATHFRSQARADRFESLVAIEAERQVVGCKTITREVLEREREIVRNEARERAGDVNGAVLAALYPTGHPYAVTPLGTPAGLDAITLDDVCTFIDRYYTPDRAFMVIAGNVSAPTVNAALVRHLGIIAARKPAERWPVPPAPPRGGTVTLEADVDEVLVVAAWPTPPRYSVAGDAVPLGMRAMHFGGSDPFMKEVVEDLYAKVAGGVAAPFAVIGMSVANEGRVAFAKQSILRSADVAGFLLRYQSNERTQHIGADLGVELLARFESLAGRAELYADWRQFRDGGAGLAAELARIDAIDARTIGDSMAETFRKDKITWIVVKPRSRAPEAAWGRPSAGEGSHAAVAVAVDGQEAARPVLVPERPTQLAAAQSTTLANGLKVMLLPVASDVPMVSVRLIFGAGTAHEEPRFEGIAAATAS